MSDDVKTLIKIGTADPVDVADLKQPLPSRDFRDAWQLNGDVVSIDPIKAQKIAKDKVRQERSGRLIQLDAKWTMAMGKKDQVKADAIEANRQKLRDATADPRLNNTDPKVLKQGIDGVVADMETAVVSV